MKTSRTIFVMVLLAMAVVLSFTALPSFAQDGADEHNPCLNGTWYCPDPDDPAREEWNWACGWYWAHFFAGEYGKAQMPDWCIWRWPEGYCQVNLANISSLSYDGIHYAVGFDIWTSWPPGTFVQWTPVSQDLPACFTESMPT